jgi:hypothetical protein
VGADSELVAGTDSELVVGTDSEFVVSAVVADLAVVVAAVGAAAGRSLRLVSVGVGVSRRVPESELLVVLLTTWLATRRVVPTGVAWCASPISTTAPTREPTTPARLVSRSRLSAASRLRCASFMSPVCAGTVSAS